MFNKTLCLSKSRIEVYWCLFLLRVSHFPDQNPDENNLSDNDNDGGLLFELDGSMAYLKDNDGNSRIGIFCAVQ